MRKVSLVLLALIVAAGTAFASDVTITGGVQQAWGFGDGVYSAFDGPAGDVDVDISAMVDDVNTAVVRLEQGSRLTYDEDADEVGSVNDGITVDEAYFDTNLAAAFGLEGVILQTRVGYWEANIFDVSTVTGLGFEDVADDYGSTQEEVQAIQFEAGMTDMVTARFVVVPGDGNEMSGLIAIKGGYGPVMAEIFYVDLMGTALEAGEGVVGFGAMFGQEVVPGTVDLSFGAQTWFALDKDAIGSASDLFYGVGVKAGLLGGISTVGISMQGESEAALAGMGVDINVAPVAFAGLDFAVAMGIDSDLYDESLQYLEVSGYLKPGAATFRLGYAFYDGTTDAGSLYSDYKAGGFIAGAESGFMFLNTSLSF